MIINLPKNMAKETTHRYGPNAFKLHRCLRVPTDHEHSCSSGHCMIVAFRQAQRAKAATVAFGHGQGRCWAWSAPMALESLQH